jgi:hypothetical protein
LCASQSAKKKAFANGNSINGGDNTLKVYKMDDNFIFEDEDNLNPIPTCKEVTHKRLATLIFSVSFSRIH